MRRLILVSNHKAPDERAKGWWLAYQPFMNRDIRFEEDAEGDEVYTATRLGSYCGIGHGALERDDVSLTGWWMHYRAAIELEETGVL